MRKSNRQFVKDRAERKAFRAARWERILAACPSVREHLTLAQANALCTAEYLINGMSPTVLHGKLVQNEADGVRVYPRRVTTFQGYSADTLLALAEKGLGEYVGGEKGLVLNDRGRAWAQRLLELAKG